MLDGIHSFFQRIPSRTVVYPTIYGRMRQGRARLTAGDISRLDEVPYLDGYRPNLTDAIKLNAADLAADPAALKVLLVVTDGRDFADPKGEGPGNFADLGAQLRRVGITLLAARYRPEADAAQAAANLRDLHDAAGGFLSARDQIEDLENTLESLGQAVADLQRVEVEVPWMWRLFGGEHRFSAAADQRRRRGDDDRRRHGDRWSRRSALDDVRVDPGGRRDGGGHDHAGVAAPGRSRRARQRRGPGRSGARSHPPRRLARAGRRGAGSPVPGGAGVAGRYGRRLAGRSAFPVPAHAPRAQTHAGRSASCVAERSGDTAGLGESLARVLSEAVAGQMPAEQAAEKVNAHASAEERAAFVGLDLNRLAEALRGAARAHPPLGTPRARGIAVAIQDALRTGEKSQGVAVGWLVRAGGPGRRGETLRLAAERTVIGCTVACAVRIIDDPAMAPEHAEIVADDEEFAIAPLGGAVRIEGQPVTRRQALVDGETINLGSGMYVFKCASVGNLATVRGTKGAIRR